MSKRSRSIYCCGQRRKSAIYQWYQMFWWWRSIGQLLLQGYPANLQLFCWCPLPRLEWMY